MDVKRVSEWLLHQHIIVTRDDKSKKMVMLKEDSYESFILQYIADSKAKHLLNNPTSKLAVKVGKFFQKPNLPSFIGKKKVPNPACPRIFSFIKTHKNPVSARPIVEKQHSPTFYLEKSLAMWCTCKLEGYRSSFKSSQEFLDRLHSVSIKGTEIISVLD